jgi:hypothetical protein
MASELRCPCCRQPMVPPLAVEPTVYFDKVLLMLVTYVPGEGWLSNVRIIDPEGELRDAPLDYIVSTEARGAMRAIQHQLRKENPE